MDFRLDTQNSDGIISATVLFSEVQSRSINKKQSPCKAYSDSSEYGELTLFKYCCRYILN